MLPIIGIAGNQLIRATDTFQGNQVTYTPQGFVMLYSRRMVYRSFYRSHPLRLLLLILTKSIN